MMTVFVVVGFGLLSCSGRGCCFCQVRGAEIASLKSTRSDVARRPSPKGSVGGNLGGQMSLEERGKQQGGMMML